MSGRSDVESGEGFARSVETASGVTVLAAIGRKCVGKVLFLEETERERVFLYSGVCGGKWEFALKCVMLWAAFSIPSFRASFPQTIRAFRFAFFLGNAMVRK